MARLSYLTIGTAIAALTVLFEDRLLGGTGFVHELVGPARWMLLVSAVVGVCEAAWVVMRRTLTQLIAQLLNR